VDTRYTRVMAVLSITNVSGAVLPLSDLYVVLNPGQSTTISRYLPDLERMPKFMEAFRTGSLAVNVLTLEPWELYWRTFLSTQPGGYALEASSRIVHLPVVTPTDSKEQPGQGPTPVVYGVVMGLHFDLATESAYRVFKIPTAFTGADASFHIHWTKSANSNEAGKTVRWRLSYKVFDGRTQDITAAPTVLTFDDTYDDTGTTTRIVYRTSDVAAVGFTAGYYVGVMLEYVAANTTLVGGPVAVSVDLLLREYINRAN